MLAFIVHAKSTLIKIIFYFCVSLQSVFSKFSITGALYYDKELFAYVIVIVYKLTTTVCNNANSMAFRFMCRNAGHVPKPERIDRNSS